MYICMCVTLLPLQSYCVGGPHQQRGIRCVVWVIIQTSLHKAAENLADFCI